MPGALPVLNERAVELAVRCALALNCRVNTVNRFDRKNYFYPDLPKAYQISQLYFPFAENGYVDIELDGKTKRIGIKEIHLEEDAGKLIHQNGKTLVDYNRAGVPLLEIVSEPDMNSGREAAALVRAIRETLYHCGICSGKMQEGALRADINVSVRKRGSSALGTRTEMKNLASIKAVALAVDSEAKRQIKLIEKGESVNQQTRRWDEEKNESYLMRTKETAQDYRYFPEPDLPPLVIKNEYIERIRKAMPELLGAKKARYIADLGLSDYDASQLCRERAFFELFENTVALGSEPKETANRILGDITMLLNESGVQAEGLIFEPKKLAQIIELCKSGKINRDSSKKVLAAVYYEDAEPLNYIKENSLESLNDTALIEKALKTVVASNEKAVSEYLGGKEKSFNFLFGQTMKALSGKADPSAVKEILSDKLTIKK